MSGVGEASEKCSSPVGIVAHIAIHRNVKSVQQELVKILYARRTHPTRKCGASELGRLRQHGRNGRLYVERGRYGSSRRRDTQPDEKLDIAGGARGR